MFFGKEPNILILLGGQKYAKTTGRSKNWIEPKSKKTAPKNASVPTGLSL
jgi:hypothetical protein